MTTTTTTTTTTIYSNNGLLSFSPEGEIASVEEYMNADRCIGSIFEALEEGEMVELKEGLYLLDEDLDLEYKTIKQGVFHRASL